jgi:hypothetical protein
MSAGDKPAETGDEELSERMLSTEIREVPNLRDTAKPWRLAWQTASMAAPAFWYFHTREQAEDEEQNLRKQNRLTKDLR